MLFCKHVLKQRENIPSYGKTINNFFLEKDAIQFSGQIVYLKIF